MLGELITVGIVGVDDSKIPIRFRCEVYNAVLDIVKKYTKNLTDFNNIILVSGKSPKKGVDDVVEEIANLYTIPYIPKPPKGEEWKYYKRRNLQIAKSVDVLYCISIEYPGWCKHCKEYGHMENGGCWTMKEAAKMNVDTSLVVVPYI